MICITQFKHVQNVSVQLLPETKGHCSEDIKYFIHAEITCKIETMQFSCIKNAKFPYDR